MTIPASGQIRLSSNLGQEVGYTNGMEVSLNANRIRSLIPGRSSGAQSRFNDYRGKEASKVAVIVCEEEGSTTFDRHGICVEDGIPWNFYNVNYPAFGSNPNGGFGSSGGMLSNVYLLGMTYYGFPASGTPNLTVYYDSAYTHPDTQARYAFWEYEAGGTMEYKDIQATTYNGGPNIITSQGPNTRSIEGLNWSNQSTPFFNPLGTTFLTGDVVKFWFVIN